MVIADVRPDEAAATAARIADRTGGTCTAQHLDVTDETSISGAFEGWHRTWGALDILVNNAGVFSNHLAHEMPVTRSWTASSPSTCGAPTCAPGRHWDRCAPPGRGAIVNVASVDAMVTSAEGLTHYTTSKHAIAGMTRSIAVEAAPLGVRINAVCPGAAMTEGAVEFITGGQETGIDVVAQWDGIVERTPLGRLCDVDDVARAVVFLASDMAAFVTGVLLPVDGGILVQPLEGYVPHTEDT